MKRFDITKNLYIYIGLGRLSIVHPLQNIPISVILLPKDTKQSAKFISELVKCMVERGFSVELLHSEIGKSGNIYPEFSFTL